MFRILPKEFPYSQFTLGEIINLFKFHYIINLFEYNQKLLTISKTDSLKNKIMNVETKYSVSILIGLCLVVHFANKDIKVLVSTHNEKME